MPDDGDSSLWAAVVLQAKDDVEGLPIDSLGYREAAEFLTSESPYWRQGRAEVAAHLGFTGDEIRRVGLGWVIARRRAAGLPDVATPPPPKPPKPEIVPVPELQSVLQHTRNKRGPLRRLPPELNPFSPLRMRHRSEVSYAN